MFVNLTCFTPLRDTVTEPEIKFNKTWIKTMDIIEKVFGLWIQVWGLLIISMAIGKWICLYFVTLI